MLYYSTVQSTTRHSMRNILMHNTCSPVHSSSQTHLDVRLKHTDCEDYLNTLECWLFALACSMCAQFAVLSIKWTLKWTLDEYSTIHKVHILPCYINSSESWLVSNVYNVVSTYEDKIATTDCALVLPTVTTICARKVQLTLFVHIWSAHCLCTFGVHIVLCALGNTQCTVLDFAICIVWILTLYTLFCVHCTVQYTM